MCTNKTAKSVLTSPTGGILADQEEISELKAKLNALERQNEKLKSSQRTENTPKRRGRAFLSAVLIVTSVVLAPLATVGTWTRTMLVDTDRFVETFAPLADDPAVQAFIADQAINAIEENIDIDGLVSDVFSGFAQLPLGEKASSVLPLLEAPAADGIRSMINSGVNNIVRSEAFSNVWETTLRETHSRTVALIQGTSDGAVDLRDDGAITLNLKTLISEVKTLLVDGGLGIASQIPEINKTIVLFQSDSLTLIRVLYQLAMTFSYWLPWVALALLVTGVVLANNRPRALFAASISLSVVFFVMASGLNIGSHLFVFQVSPSIMTAAAAYAIYNQLTLLMSSTLVALTVLSIIVAIGSWLVGSSRAAQGLRDLTQSAFGFVRESAEKRGISTGKFGATVDKLHTLLVVATLLIAVFILFLSRPIALSTIVVTLLVVVLVLISIELVRRPESAQEPSVQSVK